MFAVKSPIYQPSRPMYRRKVRRSVKCYYTINNDNSTPLEDNEEIKMFHVLAFIRDGDTGIYTIKSTDEDDVSQNHIIAFTNFEDAFRYKTLLEAEMKLTPFVQFASHFELTHACNVGNYKCRVVDPGALVTPPSGTVQITDWERRSALLEGRWTVKEKNDT